MRRQCKEKKGQEMQQSVQVCCVGLIDHRKETERERDHVYVISTCEA